MSSAIRLMTIVLMLGALGAAGCSAGSVRVPDGPPGITGEITSLEKSTTEIRYTALIEGEDQEPGAVSDKASVAITDDTVIIGLDGERMEADELKEGLVVRVWFDGAVAESYPVQGTAGVIQRTP